jgi:hypothetical protein
MRSKSPAFVGTHDMADAMGLTPEYIAATVVHMPGFPSPAIAMSRKTRLWDSAEFSAWLEARRVRGALQSPLAMRGSTSATARHSCARSHAPA